MKILFLDIDGVLNSHDFFINRELERKEKRKEIDYKGYERSQDIDPKNMKVLNELCGSISNLT